MPKYKIINETSLSYEEIGFLVDLYINSNISYSDKVERITFEYNRKLYCITCKHGIGSETFIIKEGKKNA